MKQKPLSELSLEELMKQKTKLKSMLTTWIVLQAILVGALIYLATFGKPILALFAVLPGLLIIMVPAFISLNKVNAEIKVRNAKI